MTDNQEDKLPWAVGRCCFTNDNPPPLQDGTLYKSASYKFSRTTDIHSLFKGTYAQIPESEAREFMLLRKQVVVLREALKIYANEDRWSNAIIVNVEEKLQGVATFQMLHGKSVEIATEALRRCDEIGEEKK